MPKKPTRNAFYLFMKDFGEDQRKAGRNFANMMEVQQAAGPAWEQAPPHIRKKYNDRAKMERERLNGSDQKFTSTGIPLSVIEQQAQEKKNAELAELRDIKDFVYRHKHNNSLKYENIYIMDVNWYCKFGIAERYDYLIAEMTILCFSLEDGIKSNYHEIINPGYIPTGYASDVKEKCKELGMEMPDSSVDASDYISILANIIDYLKNGENLRILPPLYTMPDKVIPITHFIQQMCYRAAEDDSLFRIYRLDTLFCDISNALAMRDDDGFPKQSLALDFLAKDTFKYSPQLGCELHEAADKSVECTKSRTKRWAFTILDRCCVVAGINIVPGKHLPHDLDMKGLLNYKEAKKERALPSVACSEVYQGSYTPCGSVVDEPVAAGSGNKDGFIKVEKKGKRVHQPLRMPNIAFDVNTLEPFATTISKPDFPQYGGRGRGIARSFADMKIGKK